MRLYLHVFYGEKTGRLAEGDWYLNLAMSHGGFREGGGVSGFDLRQDVKSPRTLPPPLSLSQGFDPLLTQRSKFF